MQSGHIDQAVILATGAPLEGAPARGKLAGPATLTSLGGLSLIKRAIQVAARRAGVRKFVVVLGAGAEGAQAELTADPELADLQLNFELDRDGEGLLAAGAHLNGEFFLARAELVFDPAVYRRLHGEPARDGLVLAVDQSVERRAAPGKAGLRLVGERILMAEADQPVDAVAIGVLRAGSQFFDALRAVRGAGEPLNLAKVLAHMTAAGQARVAAVDANVWWQPVRSVAEHTLADKALFKSLTKAIDGPVSKAINRKFSKRVTRMVMNTAVVPNHMTAIGLAVGIVAAILTAMVTPATLWLIPLGGVLYQLSSMLDGVDGEIARLKFKHSDWGEWFDTISDDIINLGYQLSIGIAAWRLSGNGMWWQIGLASFVLGWVVCLSLYRKLMASGKGTHLAIEWSFNDAQAPRSLFARFCAKAMFIGKRDFYALVIMTLSLFGVGGLQWVLVLSLITVSIIASQWMITLGQSAAGRRRAHRSEGLSASK